MNDTALTRDVKETILARVQRPEVWQRTAEGRHRDLLAGDVDADKPILLEAKYESDGGPGMAECPGVLAQSENAVADRTDFIRAQFVFWLLVRGFWRRRRGLCGR